MTESGTGLQEVFVYANELTHGGVNPTGRYFLSSDWSTGHLISFHESGAGPTVLTSDARFIRRNAARWSRDGTRVVHEARIVATADDGTTQEQYCLMVGEVVFGPSGAPASLDNERCVVNVTAAHPGEYGAVGTWASDSERVIYQTRNQRQPVDYGPNTNIYVATVPRSAPVAISDIKLSISEPTQAGGGYQQREFIATSPVAGDDRVAYWRWNYNGGVQRADLFVVKVPPGYSGELLSANAIAVNVPTIRRLDWSPDGMWLLYGSAGAGLTYHQIYKLSLRNGKATALTNAKNKRDYGYYRLLWRR
jgi:hypothetical protein